ncbi:MAG: DinB family protein, partial [Acidobacteria bacterium]|nr:DinB family protein [Acidobacteriota bacterium]
VFAVTALLLTIATPAGAQSCEGVMGDLIRDVNDLEKKVTDLAKAMPAPAHEWRPSKGTRSTAEVLMHIAADNYFLPAVLGTAAPADTGITKEYKTAAAFEKRTVNRDALFGELQKSFAFLKQTMAAVPDAKMDEPVEAFGQKNTTRGMWILAVTHLHEHLGQLIAYARSNNVVPPWSK